MHLKIIFGFIVVLCLISISVANSASEDEENDVMETDNNLRELDESMDTDFDLREFLDMMVEKRRQCKTAGKTCSRKRSLVVSL
jgi:hypothetical protein